MIIENTEIDQFCKSFSKQFFKKNIIQWFYNSVINSVLWVFPESYFFIYLLCLKYNAEHFSIFSVSHTLFNLLRIYVTLYYVLISTSLKHIHKQLIHNCKRIISSFLHFSFLNIYSQKCTFLYIEFFRMQQATFLKIWNIFSTLLKAESFIISFGFKVL